MAENNLGNTQYFRTKPDQELQVKEVHAYINHHFIDEYQRLRETGGCAV